MGTVTPTFRLIHMDNDKLQQQLDAIRAQYTDILPERLANINSKWHQLLTAWTPSAAQELTNMCHSLAGSATTFGFPEITRLSRQAEQLLSDTTEYCQPEPLKTSQLKQLMVQLTSQPVNAVQSLSHNPRIELTQRPIYLVDSDQAFCQKLKKLLAPHIIEIQYFSDEEAFNTALSKQDPCLILLDFDTSRANPSLTDMIADLKAKQLLDSPLFFISQQESLALRLEGFRAGGNGFFKKTTDIELLIEKINFLLHKASSDPYRILLLDDDELLVQHYATLFEGVGCVVKAISEPMTIMTHLETLNPDILLMDLHMPDCNGIELAGTLRQQDNYAHLPIVFLSKEVNVHHQFSAREIGVDDFLVKPIDEKYLLSSVINRAQRARHMQEVIHRTALLSLNDNAVTD